MFIAAVSLDGVKFKNYFYEGRLRVYANLQNAVNGAKQLLKNPKNGIKVVRVLRKEDNVIAAIVRKTDTGYSVEELKTSDSIVSSLPKALPAPEIKVEKKEENKEENKESTTDILTKEDRIQKIKDSYEKWQENKKKEPKEEVQKGSANNLSHAKEYDSTYKKIMADLLEEAIDKSDIQTLFKLEVALSQKGYSWYPRDNENITVDLTPRVLELLSKKEI